MAAKTLTLSVRGVPNTAADFLNAFQEVYDAVLLYTLETGVRLQADAQQRAPVDTSPDADDFVMRDHIRLMTHPGVTLIETDVGYREEDFRQADQPPYYLFQEFGFHHWLSGEYIRNAHLEPAHIAAAKPYAYGIRLAVLSALARLPGAA